MSEQKDKAAKDATTTTNNANSTTPATNNAQAQAPANAKVELGLLEEDDEFEEFPAENWGTEDGDDEDVSVWEDNWEDDNIQDDFNQQLRAQLEKQKMQLG